MLYESETNWQVGSPSEIPAPVLKSFAETKDLVRERTLLSWSEHCTECVWPACYSSCEYYAPRPDLKCRRFAEGFVRIPHEEGAAPYLLRVGFKMWGKLLAPGNVHLDARAEAVERESRDLRAANVIRIVPLPFRAKTIMRRRRYVAKRDLSGDVASSATMPDAFLIECYNPASAPADFTLSIVNEGAATSFQRRLFLAPGYQRIFVDFPDIRTYVDPGAPFSVSLVSNHATGVVTIYFGMLDFVTTTERLPHAVPATSTQAKKCKCVVWDLDNTLWQGILVEDGVEKIKVNEQAVKVIKELDQRGILNSVASKNHHDEAMAVIAALGLSEYFLHPQISWGPKSSGIAAIARELNIALDTFAFVDDSEFERAQVHESHPEVRVIGADEIAHLLGRPEFDVPVTPEAASRRSMYKQESARKAVQEQLGGDYLEFLRHCEIELSIRPLSSAVLQRVHELSQRTNQLNFSGTRYEKTILERILADPSVDTYVLDCRDRFGEYGTVGFCVVANREPRLTDLMFSCRVQSKRVEHAFLAFLIARYRERGQPAFHANYRKTARNAPAGQVFEDFGFEIVGEEDGVTKLVFPADRDLQPDDVIRITSEPSAASNVLAA
jgi:FkbH-like protein